ncbi:MAG: hypothetical protein RBR35_14975 [Salinivirgaceae bacterium]|nr:hypothetical protein [Salinivirgaceae bacterium]
MRLLFARYPEADNMALRPAHDSLRVTTRPSPPLRAALALPPTFQGKTSRQGNPSGDDAKHGQPRRAAHRQAQFSLAAPAALKHCPTCRGHIAGHLPARSHDIAP